MSRAARFLLLLALTPAAASCGSGDDPPPTPQPPPAQPARGPVALSLEPSVAAPGETLRLTIRNRGDRPLEFGVAYRLERWDGRWRWLNRDAAFVLIAKMIGPGGRDQERIQLPDDLRPGLHRIVKSFLAPDTGRRLRAAARFTVR